MKNGNTLITDEKDNLTREVNLKGETVWEFDCLTDLPAEYQFSSAPQSCTRLANGNTIFTSRGKNSQGPQLIEVTPDKKLSGCCKTGRKLATARPCRFWMIPAFRKFPVNRNIDWTWWHRDSNC